MHSPGINGEGELRGQLANPGSPGKMAVKTEYVCVCVCVLVATILLDISRRKTYVRPDRQTDRPSVLLYPRSTP